MLSDNDWIIRLSLHPWYRESVGYSLGILQLWDTSQCVRASVAASTFPCTGRWLQLQITFLKANKEPDHCQTTAYGFEITFRLMYFPPLVVCSQRLLKCDLSLVLVLQDRNWRICSTKNWPPCWQVLHVQVLNWFIEISRSFWCISMVTFSFSYSNSYCSNLQFCAKDAKDSVLMFFKWALLKVTGSFCGWKGSVIEREMYKIIADFHDKPLKLQLNLNYSRIKPWWPVTFCSICSMPY